MSELEIPSKVERLELRMNPLEESGKLLKVHDNPEGHYEGVSSDINYVVGEDKVVLIRATSRNRQRFDLSVKEIEKTVQPGITNAALRFAAEGLSLRPPEGDENE